jgi:hypothetical protein
MSVLLLPKQVVVGSSPPPLLWRIGLLAGLLPTHALRPGRMSRAFALLIRLKMEKSASMRAHVLQIAGVIMPELRVRLAQSMDQDVE